MPRSILLAASLGLVTLAAPTAAAVTLADYAVTSRTDFRSTGGIIDGMVAAAGDGSFRALSTEGLVRDTAADAIMLNDAARAASMQFAALSSTGDYAIDGFVATLTGTSAGLNVFNLSDDQFGEAQTLRLGGVTGTQLVLNITGNGFRRLKTFDFGGLASDAVVVNFLDATTVGSTGWDLAGTILAPYAFVTLDGSDIGGSVYAGDFRLTGGRVGGAGFAGVVPVVPEPAAWTMMIAGFALAGGTLRRRFGGSGRPDLRRRGQFAAPSDA